jgi:glutathione S-transferase
MKLYYSPGSCSLSPHIVAREAGLPVELSRVTFDGATRTTAESEDFFQVNPRGGYVPALRMDDGDVLEEGVAIVQYLADQAPDKNLLPAHGTKSYYQALSWLTFINSELHKGFSPLFNPTISDEAKAPVIDKLKKRYPVIETALANSEYLNGAFSVADAYLYTITRWFPRASFELSSYPNLHAFMKRMESRDGVALALKEEGLEPMG